MSKNESNWETIVFICLIILAVIAFFKFLFWVCVVATMVGLIWGAISLVNGGDDLMWPLILFLGGIVIGSISYGIGYGFEKSEFGKLIVDGAKAVVDADNKISEAEQNITNTFIDASIQTTQNIQGG